MVEFRGLVVSCVLMCSLLVFNSSIIETSADIYVITGLEEGITVHNGTDILMPEAIVDVNITRFNRPMSDYYRPEIELSFFGNYTIESYISQNVTLAFVYPNSWDMWSAEDPISQYTISINGMEIDYEIATWEELGFTWLDDDITFTGEWVLDANFVVFDVHISNETTTSIVVEHQASCKHPGHEYHFYYIVGSARSFSGLTHQRVQITVEELDPFLDLSFAPNLNLTTSSSGSITTAIWDFIVQETSINHLYMNAVLSEYVGGGTGPPNTDVSSITQIMDEERLLYLATGLSVVLIIGVVSFIVLKSDD